ncbi:MAG: hypothetical protein VKN72_08000 [Nostocales cyanobacterium 94392]|nr:hypothetical protein [Nostocales cyanobacterium 94392]
MDKYYFNYRELDQVRDLPGVYAWYLNFSKEDEIQNYQGFFSEKKFEVKVVGNLKESYLGVIKSSVDKLANNRIDKQMLEAVFSSFNVPIYIGVSKHLRTRLLQHKDALEEKLAEGMPSLNESDKVKNIFSEFDEAYLDTPAESSAFAGRLFIKLLQNNIKARNLSVKIVYFEKSNKKSSLFAIETFINRLFYPILGRN